MDELRMWRELLKAGLPLPPIAGGVDVKPLGDISEKYVRITSGRSQDYTTGIQRTPPDKWQSRTIAAQPAWQQGVTQAAAENRFATGVDGKGPKWQRKAATVGSQRFGPGVAAAREDYQAGFAPYAQILSGLTLTPRGPRGDPRNLQRVAEIMTALNAHRRTAARRA